MKTNLAYISKTVDAAVALEMETPTASVATRERAAQAGITMIAGLVVTDETQANEAFGLALQQRKDAAKAYRLDRDSVAAELDKLGVKPLAIVPKTAWERICSESGLFRLAPNENGEIRVRTSMLKQLQNGAKHVPDIFGLGVIVASIVATASAMHFYLDVPGLMTVISAILAAIISLVVVSKLLSDDDEGNLSVFALWLVNAYTKLRIAVYVRRPWKDILTEFIDGPIDRAHDATLVRVILPEPPADVAAILLRARGLQLKVAAVAGAIAFAESPGDLLRRRLDDDYAQALEDRRIRLEKERAYRERLKNDPIVYFERGRAVAIIAQFGDFPIEKEVVDLVVNSEQFL